MRDHGRLECVHPILLFNGGSAKRVGGSHNDTKPVIFRALRHFRRCRRLPCSVDADHEKMVNSPASDQDAFRPSWREVFRQASEAHLRVKYHQLIGCIRVRRQWLPWTL